VKRIVPFQFSAALLVILLGISLAGCAVLPQISTVEGQDRETVLAYSEPLADNVLEGINEWDYTAFSRDFDPAMKKALNEKAFNEMVATFKEKVGDYQSREIDKVELVDNIYVVSYKARFAQEDVVAIRLSVRGDNPPQVAGLWFDSPKLRE
jgi:hypothetical protein